MDKKITVFKLPADGSLKAIPDEIPDKLEVLQQYVDGYIEIVTLDRHPDGTRTVMIVNDCGLIWCLPVNPIATALYQGYTEAETPICGNAIVCTADDEGELLDIAPWTGLALMMFANDMRKTRGEADVQRGS
ncbi:MAG: DUF3846 domain-containing protein [Clostridiales bacterium]|nr:DUF3846 domain-containing protein [Clostridiales bacterium]